MRQRGVGVVLIVISVGLIVSLIVFWLYLQTIGSQTRPPVNQNEPSQSGDADPDQPPVKLKSIGVNLDYYNPNTGKAGDFVFTKQKLPFNRLLMGYGFVIPSEMSSSGDSKSNPQPTFVLPLGTKVLSLIDGIVVEIPKLYSGDYSVMVSTDGSSRWRFETEHVINPIVKVGDRVRAGQALAEVSDYDRGTPEGFGIVEIGILRGGNPPRHLCPFAYLDDSIKDEVFNKLAAFYKDWETYKADNLLYQEGSEVIPGCLTDKKIEG